MEKYDKQKAYRKMLSDIQEDVFNVQRENSQIDSELHKLEKTIYNIESAQEIINSIKKTAEIINNTSNPSEFFEEYGNIYYLVDRLESIPNIEYSAQPPNEIRRELRGQRKPAIKKMIERYYNNVISNGGSYDMFYKNISKYFSYMDSDHKKYVNQLRTFKGRNKDIKKYKNIYTKISYILNRILLPYAKIVFVIWTFLWVVGSRSFFKDLPYILFGYIFFCGIADLIYYKNKKKYNKYLIKILEKENKRLEKELIDINPEKYKNIFNNRNTYTNQNFNITNYDSMEGHQFEHFCADILKKNGFINVEVTQGSGDHGIDILAEKDGITYAIQCKCYSSNIGNSAVQQAHTGKSLYHKDIAVVLTNRYFTPQATEEANSLGVKLWDRDKLNEMIKFGRN